MSRGELHKNRSLMWTKRNMLRDRFFSATFDCDIRACRSFQPWDNSTQNARERSHEQKSARRIVGGATRRTSNNFPYFLKVFERQELLELTSNNSVLVFSCCECVHAFSAEHSLRWKGRWALMSQFNVVLKKTITQHVHLLVHMKFLFLSSSRVGHPLCQN